MDPNKNIIQNILHKAKRINWQNFPKNEQWAFGMIPVPVTENGNKYIAVYNKTPNGIKCIDKIEIDSETICDYTGISDKNNDLIYENDIVKNIKTNEQGTVLWNGLKYEIHYNTKTDNNTDKIKIVTLEPNDDIVIIGNTFDIIVTKKETKIDNTLYTKSKIAIPIVNALKYSLLDNGMDIETSGNIINTVLSVIDKIPELNKPKTDINEILNNMPCKINDIVYVLHNRDIIKYRVTNFCIGDNDEITIQLKSHYNMIFCSIDEFNRHIFKSIEEIINLY